MHWLTTMTDTFTPILTVAQDVARVSPYVDIRFHCFGLTVPVNESSNTTSQPAVVLCAKRRTDLHGFLCSPKLVHDTGLLVGYRPSVAATRDSKLLNNSQLQWAWATREL